MLHLPRNVVSTLNKALAGVEVRYPPALQRSQSSVLHHSWTKFEPNSGDPSLRSGRRRFSLVESTANLSTTWGVTFEDDRPNKKLGAFYLFIYSYIITSKMQPKE